MRATFLVYMEPTSCSGLIWLSSVLVLEKERELCLLLFVFVESLSYVRLFATHGWQHGRLPSPSIPQFSTVAQSCLTLCDPMDCSTPGFPVLHHLLELAQTHMSIDCVMPSNHLIFCRPLLLPPSIFPSIRVFSNESALCIR